jgi:hypothetical protein
MCRVVAPEGVDVGDFGRDNLGVHWWRAGAMWVVAAALTVAVGLTVQAAMAASMGISGTWHGRLIYPQEVGNIPTSAYPTVKFTVAARSLVAEFHGRTQAAHDAENAVSTCRITYRQGIDSSGWRIYVQSGKPVIVGASSGGPPDLSPCIALRGGAARVRPAGASLLAETTTAYRAGEDFGPGKLRGFLRR